MGLYRGSNFLILPGVWGLGCSSAGNGGIQQLPHGGVEFLGYTLELPHGDIT